MERRVTGPALLGPLRYYYASLIAGYLLVPFAFSYMAASFVEQGFDPGRWTREAFFIRMFFTATCAGALAVPLYGMGLGYLLRRAGVTRAKFDIFFAAAPIGVPAFCFVLGWLNRIH